MKESPHRETRWGADSAMIAAEYVFIANCALIAGIVAASISWPFWWIVLAGCSALILTAFTKRNWSIVFCAAPLVLGALYYHAYILYAEKSYGSIEEGKTLLLTGTIDHEPLRRERVQIINLRLDAPREGTITILAAPEYPLSFLDTISIEGVVERGEVRGSAPQVIFPQITVTGRRETTDLKSLLIAFKLRLLEYVRKALAAEPAALLEGILLGERGNFSGELRAKMAASGTTHLVALSGYNIMIVIIAIGAIAKQILSRRNALIAVSVGIVLFVVMVGAEASVVRAALMGFLLLLALQRGHIYDIKNSIAFVAVLMLLVDPRSAVVDKGFQLSFISLLGIVYIKPMIDAYRRPKKKHFEGGQMGDIVATTLAAQLAVLPILLFSFSGFSLSSIISNILIIPIMPLTMFLGFCFLTLSLIAPPLGFFTAKILEILLHYELAVIARFAEWQIPVPFSLNSVILVFLCYGAMGIVLWHTYAQNAAKH